MKNILLACAVLLSGCVVQPAPRVVYVSAPQPPVAPRVMPMPPPPPPPQTPQLAPSALDGYVAPDPQPVVSIYVEPPLYQPPPIRVAWAPPPMLVELPPPLPFEGAVWTGGYWVWEGNWVWAHGRWSAPPQPGYHWCNPYYEHRNGSVVFVNGFWAAPGVAFVAPALSVNIALGPVAVGVVAGPRPVGPEGVFVPAPPGSHPGLIVPAPIGVSPAVVSSAPPIIRTGMRVGVTGLTHVTVLAPAGSTANGQAVAAAIPVQAHLAAALPPVVRVLAPQPVMAKPIPAFMPGRAAVTLPAAQIVHAEVPAALWHKHADDSARASAAVSQPMVAAPKVPTPTPQVQPAAGLPAPIQSTQRPMQSELVRRTDIAVKVEEHDQLKPHNKDADMQVRQKVLVETTKHSGGELAAVREHHALPVVKEPVAATPHVKPATQVAVQVKPVEEAKKAEAKKPTEKKSKEDEKHQRG